MQQTDNTCENGCSIGEVARMLDLSPRTIRYYEQLGILERVRRASTRRVYTEAEIRQLKLIKRLKLLGLSLQEMHELRNMYRIDNSNRKMLQRLLELLDHHMVSIDEHIESLHKLKSEIVSYQDHVRRKLGSLEAKAKEPVEQSVS